MNRMTFALLSIAVVALAFGCALPTSQPGADAAATVTADQDGVLGAGASTSLKPYSYISCGDFSEKLVHLKYKKKKLSSKWYYYNGFRDYAIFKNIDGKLDKHVLEHIFVVEPYRPVTNKIEHVAFFVAGQQGIQQDRMDFKSVVTGQKKNWHAYPKNRWINNWKYLKSKNVSVESRSMAGQLLADMRYNDSACFGFRPGNTYVGMAFDSCFYGKIDKSDKKRMVEAWTRWLLAVTGDNRYGNLKTIYLAGTSRGGALVCQMADYMRNSDLYKDKLKDVMIVVSSLDGVAIKDDRELYTTGLKVENPLHNHIVVQWFCWKTDLIHNFKNPTDLHLLQISGGDLVALGTCHGFWFRQLDDVFEFQWVNRNHSDIGQVWHDDVSGEQLRWLNKWVRNR